MTGNGVEDLDEALRAERDWRDHEIDCHCSTCLNLRQVGNNQFKPETP